MTLSPQDRLRAATRLIRVATGDEYGDGITVVDMGIGYAEPGYHDIDTVWVFGDWNDKRFYVDKGNRDELITSNVPSRLFNALERLGVQGEWLDEWDTCKECFRAVRTHSDSYGWTPYHVGHDELICLDCFAEMYSDDSGLHEFGYVNDPTMALPDHISDEQLIGWGWQSYNGVYENGWYHREDDPRAILTEIQESLPDHDVVFKIDDQQQFCIRFTAWVKESENENEL